MNMSDYIFCCCIFYIFYWPAEPLAPFSPAEPDSPGNPGSPEGTEEKLFGEHGDGKTYYTDGLLSLVTKGIENATHLGNLEVLSLHGHLRYWTQANELALIRHKIQRT